MVDQRNGEPVAVNMSCKDGWRLQLELTRNRFEVATSQAVIAQQVLALPRCCHVLSMGITIKEVKMGSANTAEQS